MIDRKDKRFFDFMCSCGEEAEKKCEKVYNDVLESFNKTGNEVNHKDFITYLVHKLDYMENGQANIEHIYTDMWSGIAVKYQYDYKEDLECEDEEGNKVKECKCDKDSDYDCEWTIQDFWVECDQIHHGLARIYQLVEEFDKSLTDKK